MTKQRLFRLGSGAGQAAIGVTPINSIRQSRQSIISSWPGSPNTCTTTSLPGTVEAESYCSMSGVQTETTSDSGGGQNVGYIDSGDWMSYSVDVPAAGTYKVSYRVASPNSNG